MPTSSTYQRLAQVIFWLALSLVLGGSLALDLIVAPTIFVTARQLDVQVPHLPATIIAPNYVGGKTFGNVIARFENVQIACFVILMFIIGLQSNIWLDRKCLWVWARWGLLSLAFLILFSGTGATYNIIRYSDSWVTWTNNGNLIEAKVARQNLEWWHAAAEKIEMAKLLALIVVAIISAWGLPSKPAKSQSAHLTQLTI